MRHLLLAFAIALLVAAPATLAQPSNTIDVLVSMTPDGVPQITGPMGLLTFANGTGGEHYVFELSLPRNYTTFEFRLQGFDITSPRQMVPSLVLPDTEYPLFYEFPNERIWEVDGPARVFFVSGTADDAVLRLGVDGPTNVTLHLDRDVTPPTFELGEITNVTHYSFYQETSTNELALADLQVREKGATEWILSPTPVMHFRQRFPIQGLLPDREYEARVVFTDWSGNNATSDTYLVRSAPMPYAPLPVVRPIAPLPNATLPAGTISVRAAIDSNESTISEGGVRLFFDLKEVTQGATFDGRELLYTPQQLLASGRHTVAVEAMNDAGGKGIARWSFDIEDPNAKGAPMPPVALLLAGLGLAAIARRRRAA